jgi:hypothetical protein
MQRLLHPLPASQLMFRQRHSSHAAAMHRRPTPTQASLASPLRRAPQLSGKFAPSVPGRRKKADGTGPSQADAASQDEKFAQLIQQAQSDAGQRGRGRFGPGRGRGGVQRAAVAFGAGGDAAAAPRRAPAPKAVRDGGASARCDNPCGTAASYGQSLDMIMLCSGWAWCFVSS